MSSKSPNHYKQKWYDYYKKLADAKGVTFGPRQFKRIESGFAYDEWAKDNNKQRNINDLLMWCYYDNIEHLVKLDSTNILLNSLHFTNGSTICLSKPKPNLSRFNGVYRRPGFNRVSHVSLWKK